MMPEFWPGAEVLGEDRAISVELWVMGFGRLASSVALAIALCGGGAVGPVWAVVDGAAVAQADAAEELDALIDEGLQLFEEGSVESLEQAIVQFEKTVRLSQVKKFKGKQAFALLILGRINNDLGEKQQALDFYEQALPLYRAVSDRSGEAAALNNMGLVYDSLGKKEKALNFYNQALPLLQAAGNRSSEATILNNIGGVYDSLGEMEKALNFYNQALPLLQAVGNRSVEAIALNNIGAVYDSLGEKERALNFYNQALPLLQAVGNRSVEATTLNNIGLVYNSLGEKEKALSFYNQALPLLQAAGNRSIEAATLNNIGLVYNSLGEKTKALDFYNQALPLFRAVEDRSGEATALNNIGFVYDSLRQKEKALDFYNQALPLLRAVGNRSIEAATLNNIGLVYSSLGEKQKALEFYSQSLPLSRAIGERSSEASIFDNIGFALVADQPTAAIPFFKQSVNLYEILRQDIRTLPKETQETYAESVSGTYRRLADALLSQGRIGEAQQVLELLKIQETQTYTRSTTSGAEIALSTSEQAILTSYNSLIAFGQDLRTCEQDTTCQDSDKFAQLIDQRDQQNKAFETLVDTLQTKLAARKEQDQAFIDPNDPNSDLRRRAAELLRAQPGSLLIYPLVLEDKMWLLVASEGPVLTRYEVDVSQDELAQTVLDFRTEMKRCETRSCTATDTARTQAISQKLHDWMFPEKLQQAIASAPQPITNLIFAPDRSTRYIPMGALFDRQQPDGGSYLAERYSISTIVAASKTNVSDRLPQSPQVLGMGLSQPVSGFGSLPSVPLEVNAIVTTGDPDPGIFSGNVFLDNAFTKTRIKTKLNGHDILHLATHGKFEPGDIDKSFLLLGDGSQFPIQDIDTLDALSGVHLVVLSACETALGDRREEDGLEIAGISNAFLQRGAKAVIASLWQVNDPATGAYMQRFYDYLAQPGTSKVDAMQQVSRDFIDGKVKLEDLDNFRAGVKVVSERGGDSDDIDLSHPYYWSAFILIGNGL